MKNKVKKGIAGLTAAAATVLCAPAVALAAEQGAQQASKGNTAIMIIVGVAVTTIGMWASTMVMRKQRQREYEKQQGKKPGGKQG